MKQVDKIKLEIIDYLELRANDPWPDELWPMAHDVLMEIANELRRDYNLPRKEWIEE